MPSAYFTAEIESYIAHPYWIEQQQRIDILKESGYNRLRSADKREAALRSKLDQLNMTDHDWDQLQDLAERPWHLDEQGMIQIPKRNVDGMLTEAADRAPAAIRAFRSDMARVLVRGSSWHTMCDPKQAKEWRRHVVVTLGSGARASNQRAPRTNLYVGSIPPDDTLPAGPECVAVGSLEWLEDTVDGVKLRAMLDWAGRWVGIGASRKMGWGRFQITEWSIS